MVGLMAGFCAARGRKHIFSGILSANCKSFYLSGAKTVPELWTVLNCVLIIIWIRIWFINF